jgi:hypothetical protein
VKEYLKYVFNYLNFSLLDENGEAPCFNKDHRLEWKNSENSLSAVQYEYQDYLCMSCELLGHEIIHEKPTWKFKTAEEIMTAHDEMQELWERISDEETVKKYEKSFEKQKKKWTGYDYSEKEFSVVLPASPWDIINEGISLHHCVRSYLDNIVSGKTDIVFVRRSSNLEKPFYTLEVKNGRIRQCHGFANCNTSEEKGLDEFLKRFCKEKKVAYANGDKALAAEW